MFTDVVSYTALMEKDEQKALRILGKNRDIQKALIRQFSGTWLKERGDGTLSIFSSALEASSCAMEIQRLLVNEEEFKIRIGIHFGEVVIRGRDIFGDSVNIASRIEQLASPGGICISEMVYDEIKDYPDIKTQSIGRHSLKGVEAEIEIYSIDIGRVVRPSKQIMIDMESDGEEPEDLASDHYSQFGKLILNGSVEEAVKKKINYELIERDIFPYVKEAFEIHKQQGNFRCALEIAKHFKFVNANEKLLCHDEWKRLHEAGEYDEAIQWAKANNLSKVELNRTALMAYRKHIQEHNIEEAVRILEEYSLDKKDILNETILEFDHACNSGEYYSAAILGKKLKFSTSRTLHAAIQACISAIKNEDFELAIKIIGEFDLIDENLITIFQENEIEEFFLCVLNSFIKPLFLKGNYKLLIDFVNQVGLVGREFKHNIFKNFVQNIYEIAINTHNKLLQHDELKSAQFICNSLNLFAAPVPKGIYTSLVETCENYHNSLIKNDDLSKAISIKNIYSLFNKNVTEDGIDNVLKLVALFIVRALKRQQIKPALEAIKEYTIPEYLVNDSVFKAFMDLMNAKKYKNAFTIQKEFKVDRSKKKIHEQIMDKYYELMNEGEFSVTAELAKQFYLDKFYYDESTYKAWEKEFRAHNYDIAWVLKKRYKIPKMKMLPLATRYYWNYINEKDFETAVSIRTVYRVRLSFGQLLKEFFSSLFSH